LGVELEQARTFSAHLKPASECRGCLGCGWCFGVFASPDQCSEFWMMARRRNPALKVIDRAVTQQRGNHRNNSPRRDAQVIFVFGVHFIIVYHHTSIPWPTRPHQVVPQRLPLFGRRKWPESIKSLQTAPWPPTAFENERRDRDVDAMTQME
jgi:hypothetical protein